ncbi:MAG: Extracellular ligand-binding receptor [Xanthobacteraceae bacterium]|jgi:branched-chain amino acid transport system substrate-binding protein|nr:Extracellular ligand-binding receptor [Xanthobacteraceae bacterium]
MLVRKLLAGAAVMALNMAIPLTANAQISGDTVKIGLITDMSGMYADADGPGGAEAIRMAIADFGGTVNGKKIEFVVADHQNKADIGAARVREWLDRDGVDMVLAGPNSSVGLAVAKIAADRKKPFFAIGSTSSRLTNEECTPFTIHYAYDTVSLSKGIGSAIVADGGKKWFFLTADYVFGTSIEKDTRAVVTEKGGEVIGSIKHPLGASDFSSFLLQAQGSGADTLALANAGADTINSIKAADEFGVTQGGMRLVAMNMYLTDVHALGLPVAKGLYMTDGWYWDLNDETRAWGKRYFEKMGKMPTLLHAADYSAVGTYLNAVKATGTDDGEKVVAQMKATPINDLFAKGGVIRPDGRMVHDMYLMQVKTPEESKYPWDYFKLVKIIPGEEAATSKAESRCTAWTSATQ